MSPKLQVTNSSKAYNYYFNFGGIWRFCDLVAKKTFHRPKFKMLKYNILLFLLLPSLIFKPDINLLIIFLRKGKSSC